MPSDTNNDSKTPTKEATVTQSQTTQNAQPEDLLSDIWWKQEDQAVADDEEFGWFQDAQQNESEINGVGDDGGAFGFGADDEFEDEEEEKEDDVLDPDDWMTSMIQMDNVLDGSIQKKDPNKKNTKGKSMAAMAKSNASNQPIPNSFGSDDFFNQNANATQSKKEEEFDPFGLGNAQNSNNGLFVYIFVCVCHANMRWSCVYSGNVKNITDLYKNNAQNSNQGNMQNFGYQSKNVMSAYSNDPFAGIGSGITGPQPAKYVTRQKQSDPFAQFGSMK